MPSNRTGIVARAVVGAALACLLVASLSCRGDPRRDRRQVVLYCSVDQAIAEPVVAEFEKRTGIKVLVRYDSEASKTVGLVHKIRKEAKAPSADVFWSSEVFYTIQLAGEGLLRPYDAPEVKDWPAQFTGAEKRWHGFALRARVIGYNTKAVTADRAPRLLEDLLDGRWKGRIVMARPSAGTTGGDVASWFVNYGSARAEEILRGLKANEVRLVDGNSTAVRMVATGQADVCLTDTDDVHAGRANQWPVAMNFLDQGGRGALAIPNTVALVKGGPHPREARELIAFLLSEQAERMLARSHSRNMPVRESLAEEFPACRIPKRLDVDYEQVAGALKPAILKAREILR